jgi:hypothetical protein
MYIALAGAAGIAAGAAAHTAYARMLSAPVVDDFGKDYARLRIKPDNEDAAGLAARNERRIDALEYSSIRFKGFEYHARNALQRKRATWTHI